MKILYRTLLTVLSYGMVLVSFSCKKDYLAIKPDQSLLVPTTLTDMWALLDNTNVMNRNCGLQGLSTDDYEISTANLAPLVLAAERNAYLWADDIYEGNNAPDWDRPYQTIFYANVVLDGLEKIAVTAGNGKEWNQIKGSALFYRSYALYQLADEFTEPYHAATAGTSLGIPVKLSSDVNERPGRGTQKQVYDQVINDLGRAEGLLPLKQENYLTRPSQLAVWALLSRIYLSMADYPKALSYADKCIEISPALLDYNTLSATSTRPISYQTGSTEIIFSQYMIAYSFAASATVSIASDLVGLYHSNDLRKGIFLRDRGNGIMTFKGNYSGSSTIFTGLANDELYLIRAECRARAADVNGAMEDLNLLMEKRWSNKVPFPTFSATGREEALKQILAERRKELVTRTTRWADLKRLNQDVGFAVTLKRNAYNREYLLKPNDRKYVLPIPQNEIDDSGIEQNLR